MDFREWGAYEALVNGACVSPNPTFTVNDSELNDFSITVSCTETSHEEATTTVRVYQLESLVSSGTYGSLDYIQRGISASISESPP